jgi:hypothetical protein
VRTLKRCDIFFCPGRMCLLREGYWPGHGKHGGESAQTIFGIE